MLFNSISFLIFLPLVFFVYWSILNKNYKVQNTFLLIASYYFYSSWDWRFLFLLAFSTALDYFCGIQISQKENTNHKKIWFWLSICINLGFLGVFKYYNFFIESFAFVLNNIGIKSNLSTLNLILPVGISFYTFHGLSYIIDIYNKKIEPEKNLITYSLFVSFFPLLVAGPIERATHLLPQIKVPRTFSLENAKHGSRQILWGFFKKMVIADTCAKHVDFIFNNHTELSASILALGAIYFAFQIYGDFSGYSDIAIGVAKLLGFNLLTNFKLPYFSRDVAEFWRRWHISLSSWFRDYVYIPLGGSKMKTSRNVMNVLITFTISGFWHGANWTFIAWGFLNGLFFIPLLIFNKNRNNLNLVAENKMLPSFKELSQILVTFTLITFTWVFFRAENIQHALEYIRNIFNKTIFTNPGNPNLSLLPLFLIPLLIIIEWALRKKQHPFDISSLPIYIRWGVYYLIIFSIIQFGQQNVSFIYFQF